MTAAGEAHVEAAGVAWKAYLGEHGYATVPTQSDTGADFSAGFEAGAEWQASREGEWTKLAAINDVLTTQLQAAQVTIAEALSYFGFGETAYVAKVLRRADTSALAEHDRQVAEKAWWEGAEDERLNGSPVNPYYASIEQEGADRG